MRWLGGSICHQKPHEEKCRQAHPFCASKKVRACALGDQRTLARMRATVSLGLAPTLIQYFARSKLRLMALLPSLSGMGLKVPSCSMGLRVGLDLLWRTTMWKKGVFLTPWRASLMESMAMWRDADRQKGRTLSGWNADQHVYRGEEGGGVTVVVGRTSHNYLAHPVLFFFFFLFLCTGLFLIPCLPSPLLKHPPRCLTDLDTASDLYTQQI